MSFVLRLAAFGIVTVGPFSTVFAEPAKTDLNVAIFAFLPDASGAIERLEKVFEKQNPTIDIDFELWNPYDDSIDDDGMEQIRSFDIVEIDACRIEQLIGGHLGGIDKLPASLRPKSENYIGPAKSLTGSDLGDYFLPHWVCGISLITWKSNQIADKARSFDDLLKAMNSVEESTLHAAMWGKTGLGEYYADAVGDIEGPAVARRHLIELSESEKPRLHKSATNAVLQLANELSSANRRALEHFYNHSSFHPRQFALQPNSFLLGYSERIYFTEQELRLKPGTEMPVLSADDIEVRQFPFAAKSLGTPSWTDGFVVPKGKLTNEKRQAIKKFLAFVGSSEAYIVFAEPTPYFAATYLLPAHKDAFDDTEIRKKQPLLEKFRLQVDEGFSIHEVKVWQGMRVAGKELQALLREN